MSRTAELFIFRWDLFLTTSGCATSIPPRTLFFTNGGSLWKMAAGTGAGQLQQWTASTSYTARTTTAEGSFCRPTNSSTTDRDAIFECTTGGTSGSTEPTWPDAIGGTVLDSTPIWERVNKVFGRSGYQGLQIEDNIQTDGQEMYYLAIQADESIDHGDVTGWASGVYDSSTD
jgi:hypothetical protein